MSEAEVPDVVLMLLQNINNIISHTNLPLVIIFLLLCFTAAGVTQKET